MNVIDLLMKQLMILITDEYLISHNAPLKTLCPFFRHLNDVEM